MNGRVTVNNATAIIAAGGNSSRMNGENKLFADLGGIPVIIRAVSAFQKSESIKSIIIAASPECKEQIKLLCEEHGISKLKAITDGRGSRQESVLNAIGAIRKVANGTEIIAVHDGARPLVSSKHIDEIVRLAAEKGAVIPAVKVKDTIKTVNAKDGKIIATPDRDGLYAAQTPQAFLLTKYLKAAEIAKNSLSEITDDASMLERAGVEVFITEGDYKNIKITTPEDLKTARNFFEQTKSPEFENSADLRIGTGYDVHKFGQNRKLILCGEEIPCDMGLIGHSDADVATHALMDALLGSLALGDIGRHFPDNDDEFKGISSLLLLERVMRLINSKGYAISNLDITIIAEKPRLSPYIQKMRENIAEVCNTPAENVSVKATTEEGLGLSGKGIGANVSVIVKKLFTNI